MTTFIFTLKAGEVFEIDAEKPEEAWSDFYSKLHPLNQQQCNYLLDNVAYLKNNKRVLLDY